MIAEHVRRGTGVSPWVENVQFEALPVNAAPA